MFSGLFLILPAADSHNIAIIDSNAIEHVLPVLVLRLLEVICCLQESADLLAEGD